MSIAVSVIIVNWNSGPWLARCLTALQEQTIDDFEVFIVDNASSDDSIAKAMSVLPRAQLLQQDRNLGFAAGNNLAANHASGHWLALLNPDAIPAADWLANLLSAAAAHPEFSFFGSHQRMAEDPERLDGIGDVYHVSGLAWRMGYGSRSEAGGEYPSMEIFSPCAAAALYRKDLFLSVGGFDERFFCYFEDVDLGFRLRLDGQRALYVSDAIVHHAGSASSGRHSDFTIVHSHRNLVWSFFKNMPAPLLLAYLPLHLALNVFTVFYFILKGKGQVILQAKWNAFRGLPEILHERRLIQQKRKASTPLLLKQMARGWPQRFKIVRKENGAYFSDVP